VDHDPGYDEFGLLHENADEVRLPFVDPPPVERVFVEVADGRRVSAIVWGSGDPEVVLLHGGAQNAHTWDTVALALGRPLVAVDLPGHGHSDWRDDRDYRPRRLAADVTPAIERLAPRARTLVGMSLGGLTALTALAATPSLAERLVLVDVTPGVDRAKAEPILSFIAGPEEFDSFDAILERTVAYNPTRSRSSLARGVRHNARERPDGTWVWRYDLPVDREVDPEAGTPRASARGGGDATVEVGFDDLWEAVGAVSAPLLLVVGARSTVVDGADVDELRRRRPDADVIVVDDAGHSVQGDRPLELTDILERFHTGT
jgi:pimeloyl-ACP methyl ester carboxylesterase